MSKAIFYKSNGEVLCECELDVERERVLERKQKFDDYLNHKIARGGIVSNVAHTYKSQTLLFFLDLMKEECLDLSHASIDHEFLYKLPLEVIETLYRSMRSKDFLFDEVYHRINRARGSGCPSACLKNYMQCLQTLALKNSFKDEDLRSSSTQDFQEKISKPSLNQILYGPPGTGKTYHTINKALEILGIQGLAREEAREQFDEFKKKGRIEFITFHQSFAYEEFVEGIKPIIGENGDTQYEIVDGILKRLALCAKQNTKDFKDFLKTEENILIDKSKTLWRLYTLPGGNLKNDYFNECIQEEHIYAYKEKMREGVQKEVKKGDYIIIPSAQYGKRQKSIRAFGIIKDPLSEKSKQDRFYWKVQWLWRTDDSSNELVFNDANFARAPFQRVDKAKETILDYFDSKNSEEKNYILIIDEINRGNISKIFGELITLIEPSKRIGEDEALEVQLPYSQESFGVPRNLYIIGTMNTADRSITALDSALRRRFDFIEMLPDPSELNQIKVEDTGIRLDVMLSIINQRIELLLDREKTIGHAFFLSECEGGNKKMTLHQLKKIFQNKILPLLQEYFYNDYALIDAVLHHNGMLKQKKNKSLDLFSQEIYERFDLQDRFIYAITPFDDALWDDFSTYIKIYQNSLETQSN